MSILHAYFDEAGTHDGSPVMAFAGYVVRKSQAARFRREWADTLDNASKGKSERLPYFHMKEAGADPPRGIFKGYTYQEVDALARELIRITKQRTVIGFGLTFNRRDYEDLLGEKHGLPCAYAFGAYGVMMSIRRWAEREGIKQKIAYFFEAGNEDEPEAREFIGWMMGDPVVREQMRYFSDTWLPKDAAPPLQSADMLAWHTVKMVRDENVRPMRKDFQALIRPDHDLRGHYDRSQLEEMAAVFAERSVIPRDLTFSQAKKTDGKRSS